MLRQASAGMLWSKQLFYYDVARWLDGDPTQPEPPGVRKSGRNSKWRNFDGFDIISMPDKWEFLLVLRLGPGLPRRHLAHLGPAFAKYQLILLGSGSSPQGALPAYEWDFSVSTRRCTPGRRCRSLPSTAPATSASCPGCSPSSWSTSPGGSTARTPATGTCSRAASSAWTTSARSTAPTCPRIHPGAVRRHRLDGLLRAGDGDDRGRPALVRPAAGQIDAEVPGAFRGHPHRPGPAGPVGRRRRPVLRPLVTPSGYTVPVKTRSIVGIFPALAAASSTAACCTTR